MHAPTWLQQAQQLLQQAAAPLRARDMVQHCYAQHAGAAAGPVGQAQRVGNGHVSPQAGTLH